VYIINGIAYAGEFNSEIEAENVFALDDMMLLITFNNGEKRLFDATVLLEYPAFIPLKDDQIFKSASVEHGVVVWQNGDIDISPETLYRSSYPYQDIA